MGNVCDVMDVGCDGHRSWEKVNESTLVLEEPMLVLQGFVAAKYCSHVKKTLSLPSAH